MKQFYMKQKVFSIRDTYQVFDEAQNVIYHGKGKVFSMHDRLDLIKDSTDETIYRMRKKLFKFMPTYLLLDSMDNFVAEIRKKISLRTHLSVQCSMGDYAVKGDIMGHTFSILDGEKEVANVTKKWISWGDTYQITIHEDKKVDFIIALIILVDKVFHESDRRSSHS